MRMRQYPNGFFLQTTELLNLLMKNLCLQMEYLNWSQTLFFFLPVLFVILTAFDELKPALSFLSHQLTSSHTEAWTWTRSLPVQYTGQENNIFIVGCVSFSNPPNPHTSIVCLSLKWVHHTRCTQHLSKTRKRIDVPISLITVAVGHVRSQFAVGSLDQVVQSICNVSQEVKQNAKIISCTQKMLHDRHSFFSHLGRMHNTFLVKPLKC